MNRENRGKVLHTQSLPDKLREELEYRLAILQRDCHHTYTFIRRVRGLTKICRGAWYWRTEHEYVPGQFEIYLVDWPGFTYKSSKLGWIVVGMRQNEAHWMILDLQVIEQHQGRGVGTALVQAAIALTETHGAQKLHGILTREVVQIHPFLPSWYERLGFTIQPTHGKTKATFWMDLSPKPKSAQ